MAFHPVVALLLVVALWAPCATSSPPAGTEVQPELDDPPKDVMYDRRYTAGSERPHVDLLAGWIEYNQSNDAFVAVIKIADLTSARERLHDHFYDTFLQADAFVGEEPRGTFTFRVTKSETEDEFKHSVTFSHEERSLTQPIDSTFEIRWTAPGYFLFSIQRTTVQSMGEILRDFGAQSAEYAFPPVQVAALYANYDIGTGQGQLTVQDAGPAMVDPSNDATETQSAEPPATSSRSSFIGALGSLGALATAAAFALRRRAS